jgi:hypothetical protein
VTYDVDGNCIGVGDILDALGETNEQGIFSTQIIKDFYDFQWNSYASYIHYFGASMHFIYMIVYTSYVNDIYLYRLMDNRVAYCWAIMLCLLYPFMYDSLQLFKQGPTEYFQDPWNFIDQAHIWCGIVNALLQRFSPDILSKHNILFMVLVSTIMLLKTFFYLRIFISMSFLVSMLKQVFLDLRPFLTMLVIIYLMFSLIFGVLDWGQYEYDNTEAVRGIQYTSTGPDKEYMLLHKVLARMIYLLRTSIGDNNFDASTYLPVFQNALFFVFFVIATIITQIIFLNFIIAEVSNSYTIVKETLHYSLLQERGMLVSEAEDMIRSRFGMERVIKWKHLFPKFIIKRELDE